MLSISKARLFCHCNNILGKGATCQIQWSGYGKSLSMWQYACNKDYTHTGNNLSSSCLQKWWSLQTYAVDPIKLLWAAKFENHTEQMMFCQSTTRSVWIMFAVECFFVTNVWLLSNIVTKNNDSVHLSIIWNVKFWLIVNIKGLINMQLINWQC